LTNRRRSGRVLDTGDRTRCQRNINAPVVGFVGFTLVQGLIGYLIGKGIISRSDRTELLNGLLLNLEAYPVPNDPAVQEARKIIEAMIYQSQQN
jgi:hypothetical protein